MIMNVGSNEAFLSELDAEVSTTLARIAEKSSAGEPGPGVTVASLLQLALKNELEATEQAAGWIARESDLNVKLALARQCGDEAKHYRLIEKRLEALGVDTSTLDPRASGLSPMYIYLDSLATTVERVAAGQFTREALATVRNEVFIEYCVAMGDHETAGLYRDVILPDERQHHELGRRLLARFAIDEESQSRARTASRRALELAEEIQEMARMKKGIARAPGC